MNPSFQSWSILMVAKNMKKVFSLVLSLVFATASSHVAYGYQSQSSATSTDTDTGSPTEPAPQSAAELESLVAPIALYPDALVAQILSAATFPDQVAIADYWLQENKSLTGSALMQAVDKQTWDPSVKALTQFPSVLENMAKNLSWTSSLGEAFHGQQAEVMTAIQTLRAKAKSAGQSENYFPSHCGSTVAASDRHPADKSRKSFMFRYTTRQLSMATLTWSRRIPMFLLLPVRWSPQASSGSAPGSRWGP